MAKKLSRLAKLSGLTSKVSSTYIAQRIKGAFQSEEEQQTALQQLHLENAERITEAMGILKGAAMKVGQSMAVFADSLDLPEDISKMFSRLQDKADPVDFKTISSVLEKEYNGRQDEFFARIDPTPLGTASLAQAHAAWLKNGQAVVIKVLHEEVEGSVGTDLTALKAILITGRFLKRSREEIDLIFDEIKLRLLEELDYEQEARNLRKFHQFFEDREYISIPLPIDELCTKRVLVMDRLLGSNLEDFVLSATPETKQRAGDTLTEIFHEMTYVFRALHADPHGGNFLFKQDGSIGVIDFGCVKRLPAQFMLQYSQLSNTIVDKEEQKMLFLSKEMGILCDASSEAEQQLWKFAIIVGEPFQSESYTCGIEDDHLMHRIKDISSTLLKYPEIRSPRDMIFLHRSLVGIYSMLCKLQHHGEYEKTRRSYAQHVIDVNDGIIEDLGWK